MAAAEAEVRRVLEEGTGAEASAARARSESISALQLQLKEAESARDSAQQRLAAMEKVYNVLLVSHYSLKSLSFFQKRKSPHYDSQNVLCILRFAECIVHTMYSMKHMYSLLRVLLICC